MTEKELKKVTEMILSEMRREVEQARQHYIHCSNNDGEENEDTIRSLSWYSAYSQFLFHMENQLKSE